MFVMNTNNTKTKIFSNVAVVYTIVTTLISRIISPLPHVTSNQISPYYSKYLINSTATLPVRPYLKYAAVCARHVIIII